MNEDATKEIANGIPETTIGIDLGDRHCQICVLDAAAEIVEESRIRTTREALERYFRDRDQARIALEVGTHSSWISSLLTDLGHEVFVANARKLRMIYENENKSDRVDAEMLARLARMDPKLLAPIRHRARPTQESLSVVRSRKSLVEVRTKLINHVRGTVKVGGDRVPPCSAASFHKCARRAIPEGLEVALVPVVDTIEILTEQIKTYDGKVADLCKEFPETESMRQISGVGPVTALTFALTIEDPLRFKNGRQVGAYLGLCPRRSQTGDGDPQLRIHKRGDAHLRSLLVGSAHYILGPFGPDCDLRRWGLAYASSSSEGARKRAVIAVARKLSGLLYRLWVDGEPYEPLRNAQRIEHQAA